MFNVGRDPELGDDTPEDELSRQQYSDNPANFYLRNELYRFAEKPFNYYEVGYQRALELVDIASTDIVADIGCFDGKAFLEAAKTCNITAQLVGIDAYDQAYRDGLAFSKTSPAEAGFAFLKNKAERIWLPDNTVKVVSAHNVLHAVGNIELALAEIKRVTLPGGIVLITANGKHNMYQKHKFEPKVAKRAAKILGRPYEKPVVPASRFSSEEAPAKLEAAGFEIIGDPIGEPQIIMITRERYEDYVNALLTSINYVPGMSWTTEERKAWRKAIEKVVEPKVMDAIKTMEAQNETFGTYNVPHFP